MNFEYPLCIAEIEVNVRDFDRVICQLYMDGENKSIGGGKPCTP